MVNLIEAIILSIIQGVTEWFPISSSGHLALFQNLFGFQNLPYDVFLHFASIIAVIILFWEDILKLLRFDKESRRYIKLLIIAIIPLVPVALLLRDIVAQMFSNILFLGFFFFLSGTIVYSTKYSNGIKTKIKWIDSLIIGLFQAIAIFPGVSRSGATISGGLFRGLKKEEAVRFSFLLAIPVIFLASLSEATGFITEINFPILIISFGITFFTSLLTIKILLKVIKQGNFWKFGIYNMLLGILVLILSLL